MAKNVYVQEIELPQELWARAGEQRESRAAAAAGPPVDIPGALARLGGDVELLGDLIHFFFEDAFPLLDRIRSGVSCQDKDVARRAAHTINN